MSPDLDLDDAFEEYMRKLYPTVSQTTSQYRESKRIFFAGMFLMFTHLKFLANFPEVIGVRVLNTFEDQFDEFRNQVKEDKD